MRSPLDAAAAHQALVDEAMAALETLNPDEHNLLLGWLAGTDPVLVRETIHRMRAFHERQDQS